jgi:broad specificity phosphatase PhoE
MSFLRIFNRKKVKPLPKKNLDEEKIACRVLFIDDEKFKMVDRLRKDDGWQNTSWVKDVDSIYQPELRDAHVVFVDVQGVGKKLGFQDEGLGLIVAIRRQYPNKKIVMYSAERNEKIDAFISSSLLRAFKTCVGVCKAQGNEPVIEICPEIIECGCTPGYYGCSEEYLRKYYKNTKMLKNLFGTEKYEFGCEKIEDNNLRAQKIIDYIKKNYIKGQTVAVFSHHGMLEYLIPTALGIKTRDFFFALDNISVTEVDICEDGKAVLRCVNS